jgi:hypothetical protein
MNLQRVSEIFFEELYVMPAGPVCGRTSDGHVVDGMERVADPAEGFATRHLVEVLKQICRRELQQACADEPGARVEIVSAHVEISRATPNAPLRMGGWVEQISDRGARFRVRAEAAQGVVCEATIELQVRDADAACSARHETIAAATRELERRFGLIAQRAAA